MRHVLIGGVPRSGKTTLALALHAENGYSRVPVDSILAAMATGAPGWTSPQPNKLTDPRMERFYGRLLAEIAKEDRLRYVLDSCYLTVDLLRKAAASGKFEVMVLGYPDLAPEEKVRAIRAYASTGDCWLHARGLDGPSVQRMARYWIVTSRRQAIACERKAVPFIDTGVRFDRAIRAGLERVWAGSGGPR